MSANELALALLVPIETSQTLSGAAPHVIDDCEVTFNIPTRAEGSPSSFEFDPATGIELVWVGLKVAGLAAEAVVAKIVAEIVYKTLKDRKERALRTVRIRFPDGEVFNLEIDDPGAMDRLRKLISSSARR